jgi:hypothetical protein
MIRFLVQMALSIAYTFAQAATLSTVWRWFIAPQYGNGPTYSAWYGISLLVSVMFLYSFSSIAKSDEIKGKWGEVMRVAILLLALPILLGLSWCVGQLFGWL